MDYEKKYKDAVSAIKFLLYKSDRENLTADKYREELESIIPELKESEDAGIRKEMIFYFTEEIPQCSIQEHADKMKKFIAWLEKQDEQKPVDATPTNEDKVRKKVKEIFDSCEKIDVSEMEKNRAAFGLLELEAFADIFYKIGKEQLIDDFRNYMKGE